MRRAQSEKEIRREVEGLAALSFPELKERYQGLTGEAPPRRIGRKLLILAVSYELQRKRHRRLAAKVDRRLKAFDAKRETAGGSSAPLRRSIKPGGRLLREWRGKTYEVYVADGGVYWKGARYASLSAVAHAITGARWNGPRFFGLRSPKTQP